MEFFFPQVGQIYRTEDRENLYAEPSPCTTDTAQLRRPPVITRTLNVLEFFLLVEFVVGKPFVARNERLRTFQRRKASSRSGPASGTAHGLPALRFESRHW